MCELNWPLKRVWQRRSVLIYFQVQSNPALSAHNKVMIEATSTDSITMARGSRKCQAGQVTSFLSDGLRSLANAANYNVSLAGSRLSRWTIAELKSINPGMM
jgi:hypothetical protein